MKSKVYFSKTITPEKIVELYNKVEGKIIGNPAIKVHSGEDGNQNFLGPELWAPVVKEIAGTIVECNTAYPGAERHTTKRHLAVLKNHGWIDNFDVDLLDAEGPDMVLPIPDGKFLKENYVGKNMAKYHSMIVLSHFKGHGMGGFGGALKQLSIGCGSAVGKDYIHGAGNKANAFNPAIQDDFVEAMADAAASVVRYFKARGGMKFINVMKNLSVDCDCVGGGNAEDPCMADIGVLASNDPLAIDQACVDLIYSSKDPGRDHFVERIETRHGLKILDHAAELGLGNRDYELIEL